MFAPGSSRWLAVSLALLLVLGAALALGHTTVPLGAVGALVGASLVWLFFAWFLRDPERTVGDGVVSAADGTVREVAREGDRWRIAVFMNVTDVHVNRFPVEGTVTRVVTEGQGFRPAYRPDARHNLQRHYALDSVQGPVEVVQMTGILARRLVSFVREGDHRPKGSRLGMIVLGSRVDVLVPADRFEPAVHVGDRVWAGRSTVARVRGS